MMHSRTIRVAQISWAKASFHLVSICLLSLLLCACASTSVFTAYPKQAKIMRDAIDKSDYTEASSRALSNIDSADHILYSMEYGRIQQLAGHYQDSLKGFQVAIKAIDERENQAKYTLSGGAAQISSLLLNDNAIPYEGYAYEYVMLHQYQAINYLALGKLDDALVEIRRADRVQHDQAQRYQASVNSAKTVAQQNAINNQVNWSNYAFRYLNAAAAKVRSQFLNAYSYYIGGVLYELARQPNDAYIDYKKALRIAPNNRYLQQAVLRLAKQLAMTDDYAHYYRLYPQTVKQPMAGQGRVVILFEQGFIPARYQFSFPISINKIVYQLALPIYIADPVAITPLSLSFSQGQLKTAVICNLQNLSAKSLKQNYPLVIVRQALRIALQAGASATVNNNVKDDGTKAIVNLLFSGYSALTSAADLRNWLSLPNDVQIADQFIHAGKQTVNLRYNNQHKTLSFTVNNGRTTLLLVNAYQDNLTVREINL